MNWLVFHIVSGQSFFSGMLLVIAAALSSMQSAPVFKRFTVLLFVLGIIAVAVSSTPLPPAFYSFAAFVTMWVGFHFVGKWRWSLRAPYGIVLAASVALGLELPYHVMPTLAPAASRSVTVIGDSVTAGIGGDEKSERWPGILAREHALEVQDISHMGDTAASALKRARTQEITSALIVVEIGGNDLLGSTSETQFATDLDALLGYLVSPDRQILMFELPLPPFCNQYGRIQRILAQRHGVKLIPKRIFLSIIAGDGSTLDSIHLSQAGHQKMADCVWEIIEPAIAPL
jgi:acyl-CoA thioesterase-1